MKAITLAHKRLIAAVTKAELALDALNRAVESHLDTVMRKAEHLHSKAEKK